MYLVPHTPDTLTFTNAVTLCRQVTTGAPPGLLHGVVMADEDGEITHRVVLEGDFTLDHAVGWAGAHYSCCSCCADPTVLLLSALARPVCCVDPLTMLEYERLFVAFHSLGLRCRDWLVDDGTDVRSMAYTAFPEQAWLTESLASRTRQLSLSDPGLVDTELVGSVDAHVEAQFHDIDTFGDSDDMA